MPIASCTRRTALSNNCSSPVGSDKTGTIHTVSTRNKAHSRTWFEMNLTSLKAKLETSRVVTKHIHTKNVNLRTPRRALRRTQQSRWAINSNTTVVSHFHRRIPHHSCSSNKLWSVTPRVEYSCCETLSHPPVRTEHTPIDLDAHSFRSSDLGCSTAPRRGCDCRLHTLYLLMAARQTSIISATALPAPANRHECGV